MPNTLNTHPIWDTSCIALPADFTPMESRALGEHLNHCGAQRGALHGLRGGANELGRLLAERLVTALLVIAAFGLASGLAL
jgi:hypothetical protein